MQSLQDRIALVTGASRGIGAAIALKLAQEGAMVLLAARSVSGLEKVDDAIKKMDGKSVLVPFNLKEYAKIDELAAQVAQRYGRLDILVGNAGMLGALSPLHHTDPKVWDEVMAVNLTANFRLIRAFDPLLRVSDAGRAVFVTSGLSRNVMAYWGAYSASKAALDMMVKIYAAETEKTHIRVNLLDPGVVDTDMLRSAFPGGYAGQTTQPESVTARVLRLVTPENTRHGEIAHA